jgi:hypothetical protein
MGFAFNPFTGNFDLKGSGGGGGSSYIDGEVAVYTDLPLDGTAALNTAWLVREASGAWLLARKPAGIYIRTATAGVSRDADYTYAGILPDVFNDANFLIYDNDDSSKNLAFQLSGITTGTTRTITVPDANVTLPNQGTSTGDTPTFAQITINDTVNDVSTLTLANDTGANIIEFEAQELSLNHTGGNDTPYISVSDGVDEALLGLRQGEMFLQGSNAVVRIEQNGGALADIKVNKLILEDATTAGDFTATFDPDANLSANRTYDLPDASGTLALLETLPAGGTKTYATFTATDNQPPATAFATLDTRGTGIAVLDFDATTDESAVFVGIIPEGASLGSGLKVRLHWMASTATADNCRWGVQFEKSGTDLDSDSFDTAAEAHSAANGTSGIETVTEITITTIDSLAAGDRFRLKVFRNADDATNDTMTGDAELIAVEIRSAA